MSTRRARKKERLRRNEAELKRNGWRGAYAYVAMILLTPVGVAWLHSGTAAVGMGAIFSVPIGALLLKRALSPPKAPDPPTEISPEDAYEAELKERFKPRTFKR